MTHEKSLSSNVRQTVCFMTSDQEKEERNLCFPSGLLFQNKFIKNPHCVLTFFSNDYTTWLADWFTEKVGKIAAGTCWVGMDTVFTRYSIASQRDLQMFSRLRWVIVSEEAIGLNPDFPFHFYFCESANLRFVHLPCERQAITQISVVIRGKWEVRRTRPFRNLRKKCKAGQISHNCKGNSIR